MQPDEEEQQEDEEEGEDDDEKFHDSHSSVRDDGSDDDDDHSHGPSGAGAVGGNSQLDRSPKSDGNSKGSEPAEEHGQPETQGEQALNGVSEPALSEPRQRPHTPVSEEDLYGVTPERAPQRIPAAPSPSSPLQQPSQQQAGGDGIDDLASSLGGLNLGSPERPAPPAPVEQPRQSAP